MEDLIREANKIVENAAREDRKEKAFTCIFAGVAVAGLAMSCVDTGKERVEASDIIAQSAIGILTDEGFNVNGKPKEFEAKFKLMLLETTLAESVEDMEQKTRKTFEKMFWNVCLFDGVG